jgi:hypothetical protein
MFQDVQGRFCGDARVRFHRAFSYRAAPTSLAFGYREFSYRRRDGSGRRIPSFTRM